MGHQFSRTTPSVRFLSTVPRPYRPHSLGAGNERGPFKGALDGGRLACPAVGSRGGAPGTRACHAVGDAVASRSSQPITIKPVGTHY